MTIYVVTGKLGAGKSLLAVSKIREYALAGRRIATNLDLNLDAMLPPKRRDVQAVRVPDRPTVQDLDALGLGCDKLDERRYGLLVLDELAVWMNSRSWSDKSRQSLIEWLVHSRKRRWDVIFLIQHPNALDKQVRESLMEYLVKCRRFDRVKLPIISWLGECLTFGLWDGFLPRLHLGVVTYPEASTAQSPLVVDRWFFRGHDLYSAYDTEQVFSDSYDKGIFSYLPPWHIKGRYLPPDPWELFGQWIRGELPEQGGRKKPCQRPPSAKLSKLMRLPPDARWRVTRDLVAHGCL